MSSEAFIKAEKDYSSLLNEQLPEIAEQAKSNVDSAIERLFQLEKRVRQASDLASSQRVLVEIVRVLLTNNQWERMNETVQLLCKKHGQLKSAITTLIQEVIKHIEEAPTKAVKVATINNVRDISEGKIFLELERARVTRMLCDIKVADGDYATAADLLGELQVETYSSMDMREKTEFILKQVELYIKKPDYSHAAIVSRKILPRYFSQTKGVDDLKLRFYELNIEIALHDNKYLEASQDYRHIYDTPCVQEDPQRKHATLQNMVLFTVLAPFDNLQNDLLHKLVEESELAQLPLYEQLVKMFTTNELIRWPKVEEVYGSNLRSLWMFSNDDAEALGEGSSRYKDLRQRVIEHNIRVIARLYTRITIQGLTELLDLSQTETETTLANLVTNGTIYARIDRPKRIVTFSEPKNINDILNEWGNNIGELLEHIEIIGHLIAKDETMNGIKKATVGP